MINQVEFNGSTITVITKDTVTYFRANDVVTALGYSTNLYRPIQKYVSDEYIAVFQKIHPENFIDTPHAKYIQKNGVLELAFKSRLESAKPFQKMVMGYLDQLHDTAIESVVTQKELSYKSQLALTEKSHAEMVAEYEKRISEYKEKVDELNDKLDEKDKELEEKEEEFEEEKEETFNNHEEELIEAKKEIASLKRLLETASSKKLTKKHVDKLHSRDRDELKEKIDQLERELTKLRSGEKIEELYKTNMRYIQGLQRLRKDKERCIEIVRDAFDVEDALRRIKQERLDK
jgi:prophage antirepressor-like protein